MMKKIFLLIFLVSNFNSFSQKKKDSIPKWKTNGRFNFIFNQSAFSNWASGGENTIAGNIVVNYDFNYKKNNLNWDTRVISSYGSSHISSKGYRKTDDRFEINSLLGLKTGKYWFLSYLVNFRTQYSKGYNYKKEPKELVAEFLSPAYLTFGPGMLWKKSNSFYFNLAPATARYTFVSDFFSGQFGVEEGKNVNFSLGFNFSLYYKFEIMENIEMENILSIYTDYLANAGNIDIDYQTNIRFTVNKYIKMQMTFHTIMDDDSSSNIQFRQLFGVGLNYNFHQKVVY